MSEQSKAGVPEVCAPEVDAPKVSLLEANVTLVLINFDKDSDTNSSTDAGNSSYDGNDEYYIEFPKMLANQTDARTLPKQWLTVASNIRVMCRSK